MAELMSIQVHVPLMKVGAFADDSAADTKLRKVDNDGRSVFQSAKQAVDIEFKDLTYSVSEGRQKGAYIFLFFFLMQDGNMPDKRRTPQHTIGKQGHK